MIGEARAFSYHASLRAVLGATERLASLTATLSAAPSMDDADVQLLQHLSEEQAVALKALESAEADLADALDRAVALDNEPDETGGA